MKPGASMAYLVWPQREVDFFLIPLCARLAGVIAMSATRAGSSIFSRPSFVLHTGIGWEHLRRSSALAAG